MGTMTSKSPPEPQDFMNVFMNFMSAEIKWRKEDREKNSKRKVGEEAHTVGEEERRMGHLLLNNTDSLVNIAQDCRKIAVVYHNRNLGILTTAESHTIALLYYLLLTLLTGKFQELAADT